MDAAGSQRAQDDQVQEMIEDGCNVLCINLADRTDLSHIINAAMEKDIPIIFFNREPVDEDLNRWDKLYYVGARAKQSGQMQGELIADYIKNNPGVDKTVMAGYSTSSWRERWDIRMPSSGQRV